MFREGTQIGLYTLLRKLGKGGFGEVWLAEKRSQFITKKVAVKLPHDEQVNFDAIRQEATLWEQASGHPNVLPIIDADVYDGQVVIVSEYADGGSLADKLKLEGKLPLQAAVEMTIGILNGLHFLHIRKIIHRDIKPQNILLQGDTPRLADFGISRAMQTTAISSTIIGTDAYMSPEAFDGKRSVQTDIWSVGVLLYALLADKLPFPQEHPSERMFAVLTKDFEPLPDEIPSDLKEIVRKALEKQPENRYQTALEMREELQKVLIGIAHPTLAKTEVFHKPVLPDFDTNAPTLLTGEQTLQTNQSNIQADSPPPPTDFQTAETEIKTFVNKESENRLAPTQPAIQPDSVVTQINQAPVAETQPAIAPTGQALSQEFQIPGKTPPKNRNLKFGVFEYGIAVAVFLFFVVPVIWVIVQKNSADGNSPSATSSPDPYNVSTDLWSYQDGDKYGFKNSKGEIIIPAKYEISRSFKEGLACLKLGGKYGCIDDQGREVIPFKYDFLSDLSEGLIKVTHNGKNGFLDKTGKEIVPFKYESASDFSEELAAVELNNKYGFIDKSGKEAIPFIYSSAHSFSNGFAVVSLDVKDGIIDKNGNIVVPFKYEFVYGFSEDLALVSLDGKYGYVDRTGNEIIPPKYNMANSFVNGSAEVELNGRKLRIDKYGKETDIGSANSPHVNSNYPSNTNTSY